MPTAQCLCVFIKSPVSGSVKTRLATEVGKEKALAIYNAMVEDLLLNLQNCPFPVRYYVTGSEGLPLHSKGIEESDICFQQGNSLGLKMINAFREEIERGMDRVILIGSDIPAIDKALINDYFNQLEKTDSVIGPSVDGGYYLIGMKKGVFNADLFTGITWSTSTVYQETIQRFQKKGLSFHSGVTLQDIDDIHALRRVIRNRELRERIPSLLAASSTLGSYNKNQD